MYSIINYTHVITMLINVKTLPLLQKIPLSSFSVNTCLSRKGKSYCDHYLHDLELPVLNSIWMELYIMNSFYICLLLFNVVFLRFIHVVALIRSYFLLLWSISNINVLKHNCPFFNWVAVNILICVFHGHMHSFFLCVYPRIELHKVGIISSFSGYCWTFFQSG